MLRVVFISLLITLGACSSTPPEWKAVYSSEKKEKKLTALEVPPDLSEPSYSDSLSLPNIASSGSTYSEYTNTEYKGDNVAPANPTGVEVVRDGANQWLKINTTAEKLWPQLKVFFTKVGFEIKREDKELGVLDTNWLENRIDLPSGWFGRLLNSLYSAGLRDKYRARLEKTEDPNMTLVFITHQGLEEAGPGGGYDESLQIIWQPRESDPELEAEMYQRFLIFRDVSRAGAKKLFATNLVSKHAKIIEKEESQMLQVNEEFARTWRRVGIALDRIGLLVDDRNRSEGLFYLRITDDFRAKSQEDDGWLANLFSSKKVKLKERYLLSVSDEKDKTIISITEATGAKADVDFVKKLLTNLKSYLD